MSKNQLEQLTDMVDRKAKKRWTDLSSPQRVAMVVGAVVQLALLTAAQVDLGRRAADELRGPKAMWRLVVLINFVGPIAYFAFGRKSAVNAESSTP